MKKILELLFLFLTVSVFAQIKGKVIDKNNNSLPFVSVYVENSTIGTTTNNDGEYELPIHKTGDYSIVFQFLGFQTLKKNITIANLPYELNTQLNEEEITLEEVLVNSTENPAIGIIRNAIRAKRKNINKLNKYTADFYSRGVFKIKNAPKELAEDTELVLDSTGSGIFYLSETVSKIAYQKNPKRFKEHIIASKVSGENNGISFNRAEDVNYDFYQNSISLDEISLISPIANEAFSYYSYKLAGTFYDKNGRLINKIKVLPKRKNDRVFSGYIYIIEDYWAVYGADLTVTGNQLANPIIDELQIKQNYKYVSSVDTWVLVTQILDFKAGIFGINFEGRFSASYADYSFNPKFKENSFSNEILSFAKNATGKDSIYWNKVRPISLTSKEVSDYKIKDSISVVRSSKKYLDSIDSKNNEGGLFNLLSGYEYKNSYKKWSIKLTTLEDVSFNTVQAWNYSPELSFDKVFDESLGSKLNVKTIFNYSESDKRIRPSSSLSYQWNNFSKPILSLSGGTTINQFNEQNPISPFWNTVSSLFFEKNYMKIYEQTFAKIAYSQEVYNGVHLETSFQYADRKPLFNRANQVFFPRKNIEYTSNNPQDPSNFTSSFTPNQIWSYHVGFKIQFGQKYLSYPNSKINIPNNKYPSLFIDYRKNFGAKNNEWNSDLITSQVHQNISLGNWGTFNYRLKGGFFLEKKDIPFTDYAHFNGNRLLAVSNNDYTNGFLALPYYQLSTNDKYGAIYGEYNFKGALLSKVPLLNKLNFHLVTGAKGLFTGGNKPYTEYSLGLDNVGFGKWRFLRVDYVRSYFSGRSENRVVVGLNFKLF